MRSRTGAAVGLWILLVAAGCGGGDAAGPGKPLWDADVAPEALVENSEIPRSPSLDGQRFLTGWWPRRSGDEVVLTAWDAARLEVVNLEARPRVLSLDLADSASAATIEVTVAGRTLGLFPAADPMRIPLPEDLPLGRLLVELRLEPAGAPLAITGAALRPALPAGEVAVEGDRLVQSGASVVDLVHRVRPGTRLVGTFVPPQDPRSGQGFHLLALGEDQQEIARFEADLGWMGRRREASFQLDLGATEGFVRFRLSARGEGPAGTWRELALIEPETRVAPARPSATAPPQEGEASPPELVVVYVMDALRADAAGPDADLVPDEASPTPTWNRLARAGFLFEAHRSTAPNTLPSTKALFLGRAPAERGGWKLPPADSATAPTLAELFQQAGYRTALFSGNPYVGPGYRTDRGFDHVVEVPVAFEPGVNDNAARLHRAALRWLESLGEDEKVFLYIHTIHPHNPYTPPAPFPRRWTAGLDSSLDGSTPTLLAVDRGRLEPGEMDRERLRRLYAANLAYNDAELGHFLDTVSDLAGDRGPFLALTSDHGEELFDHGGVLHGYTLYEEVVRIPLVVWSPGRVGPGTTRRPTQTPDLHATLADLIRAEVDSDGTSLLPLLSGSAEAQDHPRPDNEERLSFAAAASVDGGIYSVQNQRWKLIWAPRKGIHWGQGSGPGRSRAAEYLFDLLEDPGETLNRAGDPSLEVAWLRSRLRAWIAARSSPPEADPEPEDPEVQKRLRALGYVQ